MPYSGTDHLEMTILSNTVSFLWDNAVGNGTMTTYNTGVKSFKTFLFISYHNRIFD